MDVEPLTIRSLARPHFTKRIARNCIRAGVAIVAAVICSTLVPLEAAGADQPVEEKHQSTKNEHANAPKVSAAIQERKTDIKNAAREPSETDAQEKAAIDRQLAKYTGELAQYTYWLVAATMILGGVGVWQGWWLRKTVHLAREDFNATHRPKIVLRDVRFVRGSDDDAATALLRYRLVNIGGNEGTIVRISANFGDTPISEVPVPPELSTEESRQVFIRIKPGGYFEESISTNFTQIGVLTYPDQVTFRIWFMGTIDYIDRMNTERSTAFCCYFDPTDRRFRSLSGKKITAYEYED